MSTYLEQSPREVTPKLGYLALLCALPVFILFTVFGKWEEGIGAWICATIVFMVAAVRWDLRRHFWFWIIIGLGLLLQAPLVLLIPWKNPKLIWITVLPVGILDYFVVYYCLKLTEKLTS